MRRCIIRDLWIWDLYIFPMAYHQNKRPAPQANDLDQKSGFLYRRPDGLA